MEKQKCWLKSLELKYEEEARRFYLTAVYRYHDNKGDLHEQTIPRIMLPMEFNRRPDIEIIDPRKMLIAGYNVGCYETKFLAHFGKNTFVLLPGELNGLTGVIFDKVISEGEN